jgi:integrase
MKATCKRAGMPYGRKDPNGIILHDFRRTVKTDMVEAGIDKVYRDIILGHSLQGMDAHSVKPGEDVLRQAMARYTEWLDTQIAKSDQIGDQVAYSES